MLMRVQCACLPVGKKKILKPVFACGRQYTWDCLPGARREKGNYYRIICVKTSLNKSIARRVRTVGEEGYEGNVE